MSHCIMHLPGDIMSQLMHPPRRHFVPLSQFESPHLGQSLRVSRAYLGYILGNFWPYLWHIYEKTIVQLAFFGRQIVPSDKMSHFLPGDKMSQLMHLCTGKLWKVVGTFCRLSHFVNLMPNTLGKVCAFSEHVLDISWLHFDYILGSAGLYWASHQDSENIAHGYCFSYSLGVFVFVFVIVFVFVFVFPTFMFIFE